jgi:hypothetical protein
MRFILGMVTRERCWCPSRGNVNSIAPIRQFFGSNRITLTRSGSRESTWIRFESG